jgi:hypothetical protein
MAALVGTTTRSDREGEGKCAWAETFCVTVGLRGSDMFYILHVMGQKPHCLQKKYITLHDLWVGDFFFAKYDDTLRFYHLVDRTCS